ncbi:MAG: hypothetical protein K0S33_1481 [Bacteroidetes bacterium]|jgi:hypothetical protein|nr:hypothetical protein [Bacteroidota bacterium]
MIQKPYFLKRFVPGLIVIIATSSLFAQPVPSIDEKIPYLCTFGKDAQKQWGDDDFVQTFFFTIPENYKSPVYFRVFDPDVAGAIDENHAAFNSKTRFTIFGGKGAHSEPAAKKQDPVGNFKSGVQLASKTFGNEKEYDNGWYTFGPFNPKEGELQSEFGGYIFKITAEGIEGDDGNLYKYFMSADENNNKQVEGGNAFAYEYSFRLSDAKGSVSHLYPFVGKNVVAIKTNVFDFDNDGIIRIVSVAKKGDVLKTTADGMWLEDIHKITEAEISTSLDVQFIKPKELRNNNIVVYFTNQYGELMPFFTTPIGGIPRYKYKIGVKEEK